LLPWQQGAAMVSWLNWRRDTMGSATLPMAHCRRRAITARWYGGTAANYDHVPPCRTGFFLIQSGTARQDVKTPGSHYLHIPHFSAPAPPWPSLEANLSLQHRAVGPYGAQRHDLTHKHRRRRGRQRLDSRCHRCGVWAPRER